MFWASSAHPQEVSVFNYTCMQALVFSFCTSEIFGMCYHFVKKYIVMCGCIAMSCTITVNVSYLCTWPFCALVEGRLVGLASY